MQPTGEVASPPRGLAALVALAGWVFPVRGTAAPALGRFLALGSLTRIVPARGGVATPAAEKVRALVMSPD